MKIYDNSTSFQCTYINVVQIIIPEYTQDRKQYVLKVYIASSPNQMTKKITYANQYRKPQINM